MVFNANIIGLKELQSRFNTLPAELKKEVNGIVQRSAQVFVRNAQVAAAKNFGAAGLTGGITFYPNPVTNLQATVISSKKYSPYVEWGTITRVSVPAELSGYAIQFKGRGIKKRGGMFPRPFFFPQLPAAKEVIETGIVAFNREVKL